MCVGKQKRNQRDAVEILIYPRLYVKILLQTEYVNCYVMTMRVNTNWGLEDILLEMGSVSLSP